MTTVEPNVALTGKYSVMQTSRLLGVDRKTINNWTNKGLIKFGIFRHNGRKFYTGVEIKRFYKAQF